MKNLFICLFKSRFINFCKRFKKTFLFLLIAISAAGLFTSAYFYGKYSQIKGNPNVESQKEIDNLVEEVSKLMELPIDESPTIATVADVESLRAQEFFSSAQNGDKILAYLKKKQAILYRPSTKKIINVAPIFMEDDSGGQVNQNGAVEDEGVQAESEKSPEQPIQDIRVVYYNGSKTAGLATRAEERVKSAYSNFQTVDVVKASSEDYPETIVVDLSGNFASQAQELASFLGASVSPLPLGESASGADILVIIGNNYNN